MAGAVKVRQAGGRIEAVDAYISKAGAFAQPVLIYLRDLVHEGAPDVVEEMKWSRPFFVYRGVILGNMAAFKEHCSFGLWGAEIAATVRGDGVASSEGMGTFGKITAVEDLPSRKQMLGYVRKAATMIGDGVRTKAWSRPKTMVAKADLVVPEALAKALKKSKGAGAKFEAMSPSCRKEYIQWIADAKRDETRDKRVATAVEWIADGKSRNWKYERASA